MKRISILLTTAALAVVLSACGVLNAFVPEVDIAEGAFGLGGAAGTELSPASFVDSGAALTTLAATATFSVNETFEDIDQTDAEGTTIKGLDTLKTTFGVATYANDVAFKLTQPTSGTYPATLNLTGFSLNFKLSDSANTLETPIAGIPTEAPLAVTLTKEAACADTAAQCGYTVSAADKIALQTLFAIAIDGNIAKDVGTIVLGGGTNTLALTLGVSVSNEASELAGSEAVFKLGEYETKVKPVIF